MEEESGWTRPREQTWIYVLMYMYCWMLILKSNTMNIVAEDSAALYYCKAHSIRIFATVKWQQHDRRYLFKKKNSEGVFSPWKSERWLDIWCPLRLYNAYFPLTILQPLVPLSPTYYLIYIITRDITKMLEVRSIFIIV